MEDLKELSDLLQTRNRTEKDVNQLIERPVTTGILGEYIAGEIFDIKLADSGSNQGKDGDFTGGRFRGSNLEGKGVNVKWYTSKYNYIVMDSKCCNRPDYFLVLRGGTDNKPKVEGQFFPLHIETVHLFPAEELVKELEGKVKIGPLPGRSTSVKSEYWDKYKIYSAERSYHCDPVGNREYELLNLFSLKQIT